MEYHRPQDIIEDTSIDAQTLQQKIARARALLQEIHHVPLATVNADGSPHNSPVFMAFDDELCGYWSSHQQAMHSQNIARSGQVFLVVFDSREGHGGLFIEAAASVLEAEPEVARAHQCLQSAKEALYGSLGDVSSYMRGSPQRLYRASPRRFWITYSERNTDGIIIRDHRYEITRQDLR